MSKFKILFQLSGSIACYKACQVISRLVSEGHEVQTACTPNALQFMGPATLEGLTGKTVFCETFEHGRMMDHIYLAKWADLAILCPATANSINQLASGIATNGITSTFLAYNLQKPYLIAPAMNQEMFRHPAIRQSLTQLQNWGVKILETEHGRQACGDVGYGRLLDPEKIYSTIIHSLNQREPRSSP